MTLIVQIYKWKERKIEAEIIDAQKEVKEKGENRKKEHEDKNCCEEED